MSDLIEGSQPIGFVDVKINDRVFGPEKARTEDPEKINELLSLFKDLHTEKIPRNQNGEYYRKLEPHRLEGKVLLAILTDQPVNGENALVIEIAENGMAIVVDFENHIGEDMFLITDSTPETYQKLLGFYESIYEKGSVIKSGPFEREDKNGGAD